jgi:hypothetical protein
MEACDGSRRDASMSESEGIGVCIEGGGGGMSCEDDAMASHAVCSSSSLDMG